MGNIPLFIGGREITTTDELGVTNPALGETFATSSVATGEHLDLAVEAATRALREWRRDEGARRDALRACAAAIRAHGEDLSRLLTEEQGKPLDAARYEVYGSALWFDFFAGFQRGAETLQDDAEKRVYTVRKPLGVVGTITPWNYPVVLLVWKLAPALLAGNTVVSKPSPYTPLSTLRLARVLGDVLPPGVFNAIAGGDDLGAQLAAHPGVRKIAFTGSVATGKKVLHASAADLKRVSLELGGNDAAIVLDDAVPEQIVDGLFWGAMTNSGQTCAAIKRLYVHASLHDAVVEGLVARARSTRVGNGLDADVKLGPINNRAQLEKLGALVDDARAAGARVEVGGERPSSPGFFYPPTIVTGAREGMRLVDEEQFGTALPVLRYDSLDDAIARANRSPFGLGASVWTSNPSRGAEVVTELEAGTGWVNHHPDFGPHVPFGGVKSSGIGHESGALGYDAFTELQVVSVKK